MREYRSRIARLQLFRKTRTRTVFFGDRPSDQTGRGVEFETFRGADLGEDIRLIDWIGSKTTGEKLVRVSPETRALGLLLIETGIPVHQGTGEFTKGDVVFDTATFISADLIGNALDNRLGAIWPMGGGVPLLFPPGPGVKWKEKILHALWQHTRSLDRAPGLETGDLMTLRRILPGVTIAVVFADLRYTLQDFSFLALLVSFLQHHRKEIVLIFVTDRWELDLPPVSSFYTLRDGSGRSRAFPIGSHTFQETFQQVRGEELTQLSKNLESLRLHRGREWEIFATNLNPLDSLESFAASRRKALYDFGVLDRRAG